MQTLSSSPFTDSRLKPSQISRLNSLSLTDANNIVHRIRAGQPAIELFDILPSPYKAIIEQAVDSIEFDTPFIKVIEGGYGAGKTTLIQQIVRRIESFREMAGRPVPVFNISLGQSFLSEARLWQLLISDCDQNFCGTLLHAIKKNDVPKQVLQACTARSDLVNLVNACHVLTRHDGAIESDVVQLNSAFDNYRSKNRTLAFKQVAERIISRCERTIFSPFAGGTGSYIVDFKTFYKDLIKIMREAGIYPFFVIDEAEVMLTQTRTAQSAMQEFVRELFDLAVTHQFGFVVASTPAYTADHLLAHDALRGRLLPANRHATSSRSAIVSLDYDRDATMLLCETITCVYLSAVAEEDRAELFDFIANNAERILYYLDTECRGHKRVRMVGRTCIELLDYIDEYRSLPEPSLPPQSKIVRGFSDEHADDEQSQTQSECVSNGWESPCIPPAPQLTQSAAMAEKPQEGEDKPPASEDAPSAILQPKIPSMSNVCACLRHYRKSAFRSLSIENIVSYVQHYRAGSDERLHICDVLQLHGYDSKFAHELGVLSRRDIDETAEFIRNCMRGALKGLKYQVDLFIDQNGKPAVKRSEGEISIVHFDGHNQLKVDSFDSFRAMTISAMIDHVFEFAITGRILPGIRVIPFSLLDSVIWDALERLHYNGSLEDKPTCVQNRSGNVRSHEAVSLDDDNASELLFKSVETTVSPIQLSFTERFHKWLYIPNIKAEDFSSDSICQTYYRYICNLHSELSSKSDEFDKEKAGQYSSALLSLFELEPGLYNLSMEYELLELTDKINFDCIELLKYVPISVLAELFVFLRSKGTYKHRERVQRHILRRFGYGTLISMLKKTPDFKPNKTAIIRYIEEHPPSKNEYDKLAGIMKLPKCTHFAPVDAWGCSEAL